MRCFRCGKKVEIYDNVCPRCGTNISLTTRFDENELEIICKKLSDMHYLLGLFLTSVCVYMIAPFFVPYFVAGFLSHVGIDLLNRRHVHLLYPIHGKGICFGCCGSNGTVNRVLGLSGTALSILLIVVHIL